MKTRIVPIEKLVMDKSVYPRIEPSWVTIERYKNAMQSGARFPPVVAGLFENQLIVIDGFHRIGAYKGLKVKQVEVQIIPVKDKKQIFTEAIRRNVVNGQQFSSYETTKIILTLKEWNLSQEAISEIVRIPVEKLTPFIAKRMTRITGTGEEVALKSSLRNLSGYSVVSEPIQTSFGTGKTQIALLEQVILLLKNKWVDYDSAIVMEKLLLLKDLINKDKKIKPRPERRKK